jgi:WD40 repeat protein
MPARIHPPALTATSVVALLLVLVAVGFAEPVSFHREVVPILRANCVSCHKPGKTKGGLDLTTHAALLKGGKHGDTILAGKPKDSTIIENISGDEPEMPKEGEPLTKAEIALLTRWIAEGAKDDSPAQISRTPATPPEYRSLPALPAIAFSPDGAVLAIAGHHEVILRSGDGQQLLARLLGESPRLESLAFSPDGKWLAACGGASSEFGEIQIWDVPTRALVRSIKTSNDTVYGVSFSPDGTRVAVGCADKLVRAFTVADGQEIMRCDNHIDWVFATAWTLDGTRLATASRDKALKLIEVKSGHLIDDINRQREPMLVLARNPKADVIFSGGENGGLWLHKMEPRGGRLAEGDDKELSAIKEIERLPGPVGAVAWSADGTRIAAGSPSGEVRVWSAPDGKRICVLKEKLPPVFALAFAPDGARLAVAGADGNVRFFDPAKGDLLTTFDAVPLTK